jgi:glycosyltransferase involved in cell wall biosynthesis
MYNLQEKICLVMPCYNEARRLDFKKLSNCGDNCFFLFVNDCSVDGTLGLLKRNLNKNMFILNLGKNHGKGEAVRKGMLHVKTLPIFDQINWVGFWDADLATPLSELNNFILFKDTFYPKAEAIFGSRIVRLGSSIMRSHKRRIAGRLFATFIGFTLGIVCYDSQCGAKLFRKDIIDKYFKEPFVSKWLFDVEILLRMDQKNVAEYSLREWKDVPGGSLKVSSIALVVLKDILKLRKKYFRKA